MKLLLRPQDFGFRPLVSSSLGYEEETFRLIADRIASYDAVVELGANVGVYTTTLGSLFRKAGKDLSRIIAFEPSPASFERLNENLALNGLGRIRTVNAAVSDADGTASFYSAQPMASTASLSRRFASMSGNPIEITVPTVDAARLEEFLPVGIRRVLLKIDVEGHEATVLDRLGPFIRRYRPDLIVEVLRRFGPAIGQIVSAWPDYRMLRIKPDGLSEEPIDGANHHMRDWLFTAQR